MLEGILSTSEYKEIILERVKPIMGKLADEVPHPSFCMIQLSDIDHGQHIATMKNELGI